MAFHVSKNSILSTLDPAYIEDGRQDIYEWSEKRRSKRQGVKGKFYHFQKLFIDKTVIKTFAQNLTVIVLLQMALAALATFLCQKLGLDFDVHMSIFVSPIVFPLAFSINADFQRRERVLEDLAQFKGALVILFFCHRDWLQASGLPPDFLKTVNTKLRGLVLNIKEYLLTEKVFRRTYILSVIYEDLSDISQLNDRMRASTLPKNSPLITRLIHYHNLMCHAFERLRVIREYRSPRTIRSFTKVFIFLMPILLSPYYVHMGIKSGNTWSPYYIAVLTSFIFGTLQGVQDVLDDPFDGISADDINLGQLEDWTAHSLLTNRVITVGRFTVTTKAKGKDEPYSDSDSDNDMGHSPIPKIIQPAKVPHKRKPILRRTSFRKVEHGEEEPEDERSKKSLNPDTAHRLEDLARRGMTGSTTILPGMKLKRSNSDSLTTNSSRGSLPEFFRAQGAEVNGQESHDAKRVWFSDGLAVSDHEDSVFARPPSHSAPAGYPLPEWMLDENEPLLQSGSNTGSTRSSETASTPLDSSELERRQLPEDLFEGLKNSPGTTLVDGRFSVQKKSNDTPKSLANLFNRQPEGDPDTTDGPGTSKSSQPQPAAMPSSLRNLFGPPQDQDKKIPPPYGVVSPPNKTPRPRVLPISPLACTDSLPRSRSKLASLPSSRISRSAPTTPEQERRWNSPISPSPPDTVSIPLKASCQQSAGFPLRKKSAEMRFDVDSAAPLSQDSSPNSPVLSPSSPVLSSTPKRTNSRDALSEDSRFAGRSSSQSPEVEMSKDDDSLPSKVKESSGNSRFSVKPPDKDIVKDNPTELARSPVKEDSPPAEKMKPSKPIDMPRSRFQVAKSSDDVISPKGEDRPLVTSGVPNYGVTDPSPPPSVLTTPPSRFQVNTPSKCSENNTATSSDEDADPDAVGRESFAVLSLDGESGEVYI